MEEQPVIGDRRLGRPGSTGQPVLDIKATPSSRRQQGPQRRPQREPEPGSSRRGSPSLASSSTTTSPSTPRPSASSSPTPTPPPTSARPATTSTPSTGGAPARTRSLYDPNDRDKFLIVKRPYHRDQDRRPRDSRHTSTTCSGTSAANDAPLSPAGKAIIADPRNDQTLIILQLHVAMQMFHNKLVDHMRKQLVPRAAVFESARRLARWHYQWMVTHEFLPAIVGKAMADSVYKEVLTGVPIINIKYYKPTNPLGRPFIPVEFSVAAYRFGHSITRPRYTVRDYRHP